ncbi:hypothetical protein [Natronosalvus halobius]|uniref:hypothetical protein n=1 Tax=Natronosalvus halobius TaxID=2953746 RepID=UPI00209D9BD0|nr:hypothetical protein [Natronosalvus halobius]USZ73700.1 hypothetical protein NGM15_17460 [Natronosalvus halobius]
MTKSASDHLQEAYRLVVGGSEKEASNGETADVPPTGAAQSVVRWLRKKMQPH